MGIEEFNPKQNHDQTQKKLLLHFFDSFFIAFLFVFSIFFNFNFIFCSKKTPKMNVWEAK